MVGPRQTHGVGFDFARRLLAAETAGEDPITLRILGDGTQSKSYVFVSDIMRAVLTAHAQTAVPFRTFNVATGDYITVGEIAALAVECVGLPRARVKFDFTSSVVQPTGASSVVTKASPIAESMRVIARPACTIPIGL